MISILFSSGAEILFNHFILFCKIPILSLLSLVNLPTIGTATPHFWHLTEWSDSVICNDSMACDRCLSICSISSKDGSSKGSFNLCSSYLVIVSYIPTTITTTAF